MTNHLQRFSLESRLCVSNIFAADQFVCQPYLDHSPKDVMVRCTTKQRLFARIPKICVYSMPKTCIVLIIRVHSANIKEKEQAHLNSGVGGQMEPFGGSWRQFSLFPPPLCGRQLDSSLPLQRKVIRFVYFGPLCRWVQCNGGKANSALSGNGIEDWPPGESKISPLKNKSILRRHSTAMTGWAEFQLIFPLFLFAQHWNLAWVAALIPLLPSSSSHRLSGKCGGLVVSWLH